MTSPLFVRPLTEGEKQTLNDWLTSTDEEQIRRAQVILKSAMGQTAIEIGQELGFHPDNLKKWLRRFNQQGLSGIEVLKRGPKNRFTDEQIQAIKDIYHRSPREFGLTYDSWTPQKLTVFVIQRGIVSQISHVTVRQILNDESLTDHSNNSIIDEPVSLPKGEIDTTPKVLPVIPYKKNDLETLAVAETFNDYASRTELTKTDPTMTELLSDGLQALLLSDGLQALRHNNSKAAIDIFKALLTRAGLSLEIQAQARCYLSQAYEDARNYPEALTVIEIYEDATLRSQLSARLLAKVKLRLGWGYSRLANYAKAIARFNDARTIFIELDDQDGLGAVYYALGYVYIEINESNLARGYLLKALDNLKFTKDLQLLAKVYINIGLVSYQEGDFEGAKLSYLKAEQYAEGISDASLLGLISMNLGAVYVNYGKRDDATQYFIRAIKEFTTTGQNHYLALTYNNLGNNLLHDGQWAEAANCLNAALDLARKMHDQEDTWLTLITLGELRFFQGEYEQSETTLIEALGLLNDGDKWAEAHAQLYLGLLYIATNQADKALQSLRTSLQLSTKIGNLYAVSMAHLALAEYYFAQSSYEQVEEHLEIAKESLKSQQDTDLSANGWAQRLAGKLARALQQFEEAKQHTSASINIFASIDDKYELAVSKLEMGLLHIQLGDSVTSKAYLGEARNQFQELGAKPVLQRANELLEALHKGELPQTRPNVETKLSKDVLLMQRLIEAATSKDLLLKELATIIYENFTVQSLVIFDITNTNSIQSLVVIGATPQTVTELVSEVSRAINLGKTMIAASTIYLLEDRVNTKLCLYLEPKNSDAIDLPRLKLLLKQAEMALENCSLRVLTRGIVAPEQEKVRAQTLIPGFIYASSAMQDVVERIKKIRNSDTTVLITGESGTGKELIARAVHAESVRRDAIFLPFNCTATPKELIESQLFGHRRGAFTGATSNYQGIIRAADGGTLFLDEIGDLSLDVQPKLLRFLEAGEIQPLGETKPIKVDIRILTATNVLLEKAVEEGRFREDLYHRLNIIRIHVPPLRERKEEIILLANHYLQHFATRSGRKALSLSPEVLSYFISYNWPGNIRQLRGELERMVAYAGDNLVLTPQDLSPEILRVTTLPSRPVIEPTTSAPLISLPPSLPPPKDDPANISSRSLKDATDQLERRLIEETLIRTQFNISRTAKELGLSRRGLRLKMLQLGLDREI